MKIGIVSTGDELLRGAIADTNAAWMAAKLAEKGYRVSRITVIPDDLSALAVAMENAFNEFDLVIVGGGLGPTDDDLTAEAAARATKAAIVRSKEAAAQVEAAFERIGHPMAEINLKQADLPAGAIVLPNSHGTAPGFSISTASARAVFLPGVPRELKPMFEKYVLDTLPDLTDRTHLAIFKCFGKGESDIQTALKPIAKAFPAAKWSYRATFPEIGVRVEATDTAELNKLRPEISSALGRFVFSNEDIDLPAALGQALKRRGLTIAAAESCTGGLIGHSITEVPGSSAYFKGGVISYDNGVKTDVLGVDKDVLNAKGAVSEEVVGQMAEGARKLLGADIAVAVSGIAGPDGGTPDKPVGLVHFAVAHAKGVDLKQRIFQGYERSRVKRISAWTAMWMAFDLVSEDR
jgi:nicotinamide-nucleotide amidase